MPASETVDLARLASAPPILARLARELSRRLPESRLDDLAELVERIPPESHDPSDVAERCSRWFYERYLPVVLAPINERIDTGDGRAVRERTGKRWDQVKRDQGTTWLNAWDAAAAAIWSSGASPVWQEMASNRAAATPAWDAATNAARIIAAGGHGPDRLADVFGQVQQSVLDLYRDLVEATR